MGGWVVALLMWLVCCWVGPLARWFPVGAVKSFGETHSMESSHVDGGSCAFCYSRHHFQYPVYLLGTSWGWLMGPHGSLSLRGSTGCPAPHWNDGTNCCLPPDTGERALPLPQPGELVLDLTSPQKWKAEFNLLLVIQWDGLPIDSSNHLTTTQPGIKPMLSDHKTSILIFMPPSHFVLSNRAIDFHFNYFNRALSNILCIFCFSGLCCRQPSAND